jgi:hypothetical protein
MNLANLFNFGDAPTEPAPADVDETTAMVMLGDIYSALLVCGLTEVGSACPKPADPAPTRDAVWPFIR